MKAAPTKKPTTPAAAARREDYGAPVDGFFAKQPPPLRAIIEELRGLIQQAAPDATASLKWGMPFYMRHGELMCALAAFKSHVNLILPGPPGTYADPQAARQDLRNAGAQRIGREAAASTSTRRPETERASLSIRVTTAAR